MSSSANDPPSDFFTRKPSSLYSVWNTAGVKGLQTYNRLFQRHAAQLSGKPAFHENWANCQKALVYFEQKVSDYWKGKSLGDKWMVAEPTSLEEVWDCCEIDTLCDMRIEFARNSERLKDNPNFVRNWQNCDVAIKYIEEDLAAQFMSIDPRTPLKQAIRENKAVYMSGTFSPSETQKLANEKQRIVDSMSDMKRCDPNDPNVDPIPIEWCDELTNLYDSVPHYLRPYVSLENGLNKVPF